MNNFRLRPGEEDFLERRNQLHLLLRRLLPGQPGKHGFQGDDGLADGFQPLDTVRTAGIVTAQERVFERQREAVQRHQADGRGDPAQRVGGTRHLERGRQQRVRLKFRIGCHQRLQMATRLVAEDVVQGRRRGCCRNFANFGRRPQPFVFRRRLIDMTRRSLFPRCLHRLQFDRLDRYNFCRCRRLDRPVEQNLFRHRRHGLRHHGH